MGAEDLTIRISEFRRKVSARNAAQDKLSKKKAAHISAQGATPTTDISEIITFDPLQRPHGYDFHVHSIFLLPKALTQHTGKQLDVDNIKDGYTQEKENKRLANLEVVEELKYCLLPNFYADPCHQFVVNSMMVCMAKYATDLSKGTFSTDFKTIMTFALPKEEKDVTKGADSFSNTLIRLRDYLAYQSKNSVKQDAATFLSAAYEEQDALEDDSPYKYPPVILEEDIEAFVAERAQAIIDCWENRDKEESSLQELIKQPTERKEPCFWLTSKSFQKLLFQAVKTVATGFLPDIKGEDFIKAALLEKLKLEIRKKAEDKAAALASFIGASELSNNDIAGFLKCTGSDEFDLSTLAISRGFAEDDFTVAELDNVYIEAFNDSPAWNNEALKIHLSLAPPLKQAVEQLSQQFTGALAMLARLVQKTMPSATATVAGAGEKTISVQGGPSTEEVIKDKQWWQKGLLGLFLGLFRRCFGLEKSVVQNSEIIPEVSHVTVADPKTQVTSPPIMIPGQSTVDIADRLEKKDSESDCSQTDDHAAHDNTPPAYGLGASLPDSASRKSTDSLASTATTVTNPDPSGISIFYTSNHQESKIDVRNVDDDGVGLWGQDGGRPRSVTLPFVNLGDKDDPQAQYAPGRVARAGSSWR